MYPPVGVGQIRTSHRHDLQLAGGRIRVPRGTMLWVPHHSAPLHLQTTPAYTFEHGGMHACPLLLRCGLTLRMRLCSTVDTKRTADVLAGYGPSIMACHAGMHNVSFNWERPLEFLPGALGDAACSQVALMLFLA